MDDRIYQREGRSDVVDDQDIQPRAIKTCTDASRSSSTFTEQDEQSDLRSGMDDRIYGMGWTIGSTQADYHIEKHFPYLSQLICSLASHYTAEL